jgi:anti-sigma factor RsiW
MSEIAERCAPFEVDLSALLDDQLDAPRAGEVLAHAESCRDCARRLAALRAVDGELRGLAAAPVDPIRIEALRSALASRLREDASGIVRAPVARRAPPHRRRWLAPVALAATAAALLLVMRPDAPVIAPAGEAIVAPQRAAKSFADAEVAARELNAGLDTPIGASAPSEEKTAAALVELPPQTGEKLRVKLEALGPEELRELMWRLLHREQLTPQQRTELRESLAQLGVLSPEELELMLR